MRKSALRQANERLVLNAIRENPQLSRVEISRITGLSPSSVTFIVKRLAKAKLIREERIDGPLQVGRPPAILHLARSARFAIGVEIAPALSRVALADWTGNILDIRQVPDEANPEALLRGLHGLIRSFVTARHGTRVLGVGVSVPGIWDAETGAVISSVVLGWEQVAIASLLEKGFELPFYFDNNANLSAMGERWFRSADSTPIENFIFVATGGGIGAGILVGGHVFHGAFGRAGEFGHMTIYPDGRRCLCGNRGCWEEYASDRALVRLYHERTAVTLTAREIIDRARTQDPDARFALAQPTRDLAIGLANLIIGLNPEAIIVDSWAATAWDLIEREIWAELRSRVPGGWLEGLRIYPSAHAENAALYGALAMVLNRYFHSFEHDHPGGDPNAVQMRG